MKKVIAFLFIIILLYSCTEPDNSTISPLPAVKIEKIEISGRTVTAEVTVSTPCPAWYYFRTEEEKSESEYSATIFGKYDNEPCPAVIGSFMVEEIIIFFTGGEKHLRFWQSENEYLDTTIVLQ